MFRPISRYDTTNTYTRRSRHTNRVAVDTGALLAIANPGDQYHAIAVDAARRFVVRGGRWAGSVLVLAELHGHLLRWRGPASARRVVEAVRGDPAYEWHAVDSDLIGVATADWLERFADQHFSLVDAVTFALMRRERIRVAFAFDHDFRTAGFTLLHDRQR